MARGLLGYPSFLVSIVHVPVPLDKLYQRKPFALGRHVGAQDLIAILGNPDRGDVHGRNCCICCCGLCRHLGIVVLRVDFVGTIYIIGTCRLHPIYHPLLPVRRYGMFQLHDHYVSYFCGSTTSKNSSSVVVLVPNYFVNAVGGQ